MDIEQIIKLKNQMHVDAKAAAEAYLKKHYSGQDWGPCGFAWVTIFPEHKGNTRAGKAERKLFEQVGAKKDWTGKAWQIWNPAQIGAQNIDAKEEGAEAAARILKAAGFNAIAEGRLD